MHFQFLPLFRQSYYYIIFLHPVLKKTCTHFIYTQEAMENFVFPDEMKTKLKMYEFMNIFPILTGIPQKKATKGLFIYTGKTVKKALTF